MGDNGRHTIHGFGWFTLGSSASPRSRTRGRRIETPKRYPKNRPFTEQEQRMVDLLRAERLAKTLAG